MDVKTLSAYIGHVSAATTLDIYSHVTDAMQLQTATKIEAGIGTGKAIRDDRKGAGGDKEGYIKSCVTVNKENAGIR